MDRVSGSRFLKKLSRRQVLTTAGAGVAGAALSRLAPWEAGIAPAQIKGTTLRILTWSHFVPAYDKWFDPWAKEWGSKHGVDVTLVTTIINSVANGSGHEAALLST